MKSFDWFAGYRDARKGAYNPPSEAKRLAAYDAGYEAQAAKVYEMALAA